MFPNADNLITPGQFGRIRIPGSPEYDALLVPDAAIVTDQSRKQLMVLGPDNKIEPRTIRPGPTQPGGLRIVRRGLKPEDRFVIGGLLKARPGSVVAPKEGKVEAEPAPPAGELSLAAPSPDQASGPEPPEPCVSRTSSSTGRSSRR